VPNCVSQQNKKKGNADANSGKKQLPNVQDPRKSGLVRTKAVLSRSSDRGGPKTKRKNNMTYSSSLAMNRTRYVGRNQNSVSFRAQERVLGPISNTIILIVLACLLGLLYLTQVTKTNAYGYQINSLQTQAAKLQAEHDELQVDSARLQSLSRTQNSSVAKGLVSVAPSATVQN